MKPERIEQCKERRLIGVNGTYTPATRSGIPAQWASWDHDAVSGISEDLVFGVCHNFKAPDQFDYACALPVEPSVPVPEGQSEVIVPSGDFAVFVHNGHVSGIAGVFDAILCGPTELEDGWHLTDGPQLEVYGEDFDGMAATGRVEIWIPVEKRNS